LPDLTMEDVMAYVDHDCLYHLRFVGHLAAPGTGQSWDCHKHRLVELDPHVVGMPTVSIATIRSQKDCD
jgi:hypothetical protein